MKNSTIIQGHRGCGGLLPENTIPAFLKAVDLGVDVLEMDVVITRENQVLVSHEPWMSSEICLDRNGKEIPEAREREWNIYKMDYDEIKLFDCGSKFINRFPHQQKIKAIKPLLKDVFEAAEKQTQLAGKNPTCYNIEIKSTTEGDSFFHPSPQVFTDLVMNVVSKYNLSARINLQSFDKRILQYCHRAYPEIKLALLVETKEAIHEHLQQTGFTPSVYSPHKSLITDALIAFCKKQNMLIIPWTVNEEKEMLRLADMGVDGIITDYPDRALKLFGHG